MKVKAESFLYGLIGTGLLILIFLAVNSVKTKTGTIKYGNENYVVKDCKVEKDIVKCTIDN